MEPGLPDELLLLALHDEKGSVVRAAAPVLPGALVGAAMMELALRGRLVERADRALTVDPTPTGDEILDDVLQRIDSADCPRDARAWLSELSGELPDLKDRLLGRLVAAGVLEERDQRVLWVFRTRSHLQTDGAMERQARDRIRAVVLADEAPVERIAALISLVQAANLLDEIFAPDERPRARRRIVELITGQPVQGDTLESTMRAGTLFGLVGATLQDAYRRLKGWRGTGGGDWDVEVLQPWLSVWEDDSGSSEDDWPASTWADRAATGTASVEQASAAGGWLSSVWADDSGSSGGSASQSESSSGWSWWWGSGSDSSGGSSSDQSSSSSWWDSGSSGSGSSSSDSSGWSSSDSDSSGSSSSDSSSSSSGC